MAGKSKSKRPKKLNLEQTENGYIVEEESLLYSSNSSDKKWVFADCDETGIDPLGEALFFMQHYFKKGKK